MKGKHLWGWGWEIGFTLLFGVPFYIEASSWVGLPLAVLLHLGVVLFYAWLLWMFGRGSAIEMGVFVGLWAIFVSMLPALITKRGESNTKRQELRQELRQER